MLKTFFLRFFIFRRDTDFQSSVIIVHSAVFKIVYRSYGVTIHTRRIGHVELADPAAIGRRIFRVTVRTSVFVHVGPRCVHVDRVLHVVSPLPHACPRVFDTSPCRFRPSRRYTLTPVERSPYARAGPETFWPRISNPKTFRRPSTSFVKRSRRVVVVFVIIVAFVTRVSSTGPVLLMR